MNTAYFFEVRCSMVKKKYETQFSIYKVDYERSIKYFDEEHNIKISSYVRPAQNKQSIIRS